MECRETCTLPRSVWDASSLKPGVPYRSASAVLTYPHGRGWIRGWELELPQAVVAPGSEHDFQSCASCTLKTLLDSKYF